MNTKKEQTLCLSTEKRFLNNVNTVIQRHLDDDNFSTVPLSKEMGVSRSQLFRKLKSFTGYSTALYIRQIRLDKSKELLTDSNFPIKNIAYAVGFKDNAYFSRCFKQSFGCSPSEYREKATH